MLEQKVEGHSVFIHHLLSRVLEKGGRKKDTTVQSPDTERRSRIFRGKNNSKKSNHFFHLLSKVARNRLTKNSPIGKFGDKRIIKGWRIFKPTRPVLQKIIYRLRNCVPESTERSRILSVLRLPVLVAVDTP
jgi:hypothetical protein